MGRRLTEMADGFDSGEWVYRRDDGGVVKLEDVNE
jgi:hypothetical protein